MFLTRVVLKSVSSLLLAICPLSHWLSFCPPEALALSPRVLWVLWRLPTTANHHQSDSQKGAPSTWLLLGSAWTCGALFAFWQS